MIWVVLVALAMGLLLGLLGGGGSIFTVPMLLYVFKMPPKQAIGMSLGIVSIVSLVGCVRHAKMGNVMFKKAAAFLPMAVIGTYLGTRLATRVDGRVQILIFAGVMIVAAFFMFRKASGKGELDAKNRETRADQGARWIQALKVLAPALLVGVLTGLVGVGGGFMIVPTLVLLMGVPMKQAVGTSLLIIGLNSVMGFAGYIGQIDIPWKFGMVFAVAASVATFGGAELGKHVPAARLRQAFAMLLVVMSAVIVYQNRGVFG